MASLNKNLSSQTDLNSRINVSLVRFCKATDKLKPNFSLCCYFRQKRKHTTNVAGDGETFPWKIADFVRQKDVWKYPQSQTVVNRLWYCNNTTIILISRCES